VIVVKSRSKRAISIADLGLEMSSMRVLVAEDFAPFGEFIRSTLGERPDVLVICEVTDGLEAVQKAELLEPDLVLLDIGLPTLNGIEAARQIRKLAPEAKIIFLSQESSGEVVLEALNVGAWGYVVKTRTATDLLGAVAAVLEGRQFVSFGLSIQNFN
jgi:DNA-binding NarL/FixJ family response regulator